mgnify:CR=1 FL=1|jgi:plasmid rolling circle replication initiator protein Rep
MQKRVIMLVSTPTKKPFFWNNKYEIRCTMNNTTESLEFLQKPTQKKLSNVILSKLYEMNEHWVKSLSIKKCATFLQFKKYIVSGERSLAFANFCQKRLCPICTWRLSMKRFTNLSAVTTESKSKGYQHLFLTLTAKDVPGSELKAEIKRYFSAWKLLSDKNPLFKKSIHGWFRALEITYNEKTNEYHPHLHIVLAVKSTYFKPTHYINQKTWTAMWRRALKIDYDPIVHIRKTYSKKDGSSPEQEASKYSIKSTDYIKENNLKLSAKIVEVLDSALFRVRLIGYGGVLKNIYENLKLEENDLIDAGLSDEVLFILEDCKWNFGSGHYEIVLR